MSAEPSVSAFAPATVAGLGPGVGVLGLALDRPGTTVTARLKPGSGVRVVQVVAETRASVPAHAYQAPARDVPHETEVRILSERVRLLERQIELASAPPPVMQYQSAPPAPATNWGCNGAWADCGPWWSQSVYPAAAAVVVVPGFRRFHGGHRFGHSTGHLRRH